MRALSAPEMLAVWERGLHRIPLERALLLLESACPELDSQALAALSIGRRDARLLKLRRWCFGPRITADTECRSCGQKLELDFQLDDLPLEESPGPEEVSIWSAGGELRFRLLNSLDLAACVGRDPAAARRQLLRSCYLGGHGTEALAADELPGEVEEAVIHELAKADPQAELEITINCPGCGRNSLESFDVLSFFWAEIDTWARRLLRDLHVLASAYGWSESDILSLSPARRQFYLEMVGA